MPPRTRAAESEADSGTRKFVVLSDGVTIEYRKHADPLKPGHVTRAHRGQIITLDMSQVNEDKIERLVRLKGIADYVEGETYAATTARVAVDAAGAESDPVVAPVIAEQQFAQPVEAEADEGESEDEDGTGEDAE